MSSDQPQSSGPPVPTSFWQYLRAFGPGLVIVLTWLGAGDIVDMGVSGSTFGYSLMGVLVVAVLMRFMFVSLIAKYQLCNQHGESVLDGLARFHPWYAPLLLAAAVIMGHIYESYMTVGGGKALANLTGIGETWHWAILCNATALALVFRPAYHHLETVFKVFLAILSVSLLGSALWVGFNLEGIVEGLSRVELPKTEKGRLVAVAMIGTIGGSLMNLAYPYFLEAKGWRGPQYRRLQFYDLLVAVLAMIVLNLAIWTLGAELLYPDKSINEMEDLPTLLSSVIGIWGERLFYIGIFSAVYTSLIGHAAGLAYMGSHAYQRWQAGAEPLQQDYRKHPLYLGIVIWCLVSPLPWAIADAEFVTLTLVMNAIQVVLLPVLAIGLWAITARERYIGRQYRNRWWENAFMAIFLGVAIFSAFQSVMVIVNHLG